jgi:protein TonB
MKPDKSGVYEMTEIRPAFPGGQPALEDYINNHIEYPQMAIDDTKQGTVNIQFVVDENGNVRNARVLGSSLGDGLDEEAVRVISSMPKWEPGKVKGKNVKTRLTLPITYQIEE